MPRLQRPIAHALDTVVRTNDVKNVEHVDFSALHLSENVINGLKNSGTVVTSLTVKKRFSEDFL